MTEAFRLGFMSKMADISARRDALRNAALAGRIPTAFQHGTEGDAISEAVNNDSGVPDYSALASLSTADPSAYFGRALPENAVSPELFARQSGARTAAPADGWVIASESASAPALSTRLNEADQPRDYAAMASRIFGDGK